MNEYDDKIKQIGKALHDAEFVMIGGGAGLSAAAGIDYNGENFRKSFAEYIARYGFTDLYTSSFYDFATEEELWAYWAKHIDFARFAPPAMPLYSDILRLVEKKNYFVVTTNVEAQFRKAGFDPNRLFEVQGDYAYLQCARKCHNQRYYSEIPIKQMVAQTQQCRIPSELVPHCPVCGGSMAVNVRKDTFFVQDEQWNMQAEHYESFVNQAVRGKLLLLEFGVGYNTPTIIRLPFEQIAQANPASLLVRFNRDNPEGHVLKSHIPVTENIAKVVGDLLAYRETKMANPVSKKSIPITK